MKYDDADMQAGIEEFGLLTYDFYEGLITYEQYLLYPAPYLGIALGRGILTWEQLEYLIERYC